MEIASPLNISRALPLLRQLVPCVSFNLVQAEQHKGSLIILEIQIEEIILTMHGNADRSILPLGELLRIKDAGRLH